MENFNNYYLDRYLQSQDRIARCHSRLDGFKVLSKNFKG